MNPSDIYAKTAAGSEELRSRSRKLSQRLRSMLIMVDGGRTVAELQAAALTLGAPSGFLEMLVSEGLVAMLPGPAASAFDASPPAPPNEPAASFEPNTVDSGEVERFTAARKLMNDTAVDAMGFRAFLFTLKLERCSTRQDLRLLLPEFGQNLTKSRGELFARRVADHVRALLA